MKIPLEDKNKIINRVLFLSVFLLTLFGILVWKISLVSIFNALLNEIFYKWKTRLVLTVLWTIGFIILLRIKNSKIKIYCLIMFLTYTFLYNSWLLQWEYPIFVTFPVLSRFLGLFFLGDAIIFCLLISYNKDNISFIFSREKVKELLIFLCFFSLIFLMILNIYDNRPPEEKHYVILSDNNFFPNDYRILLPYTVEVTKHFFELVGVSYFTSINRLYKMFNLFALVAGFFLYYKFLNRFFKEETALLSSVLLLLTFYISFTTGGLIEDPLNILFFVVGLFLIYDNKDFLFFILIVVSSFNRETTWFLVFMYFVHNSQFITKYNWKWIMGKTSIMAVSFISVIFFKFLIKPIKQTQEWYMGYNLSCEHCAFHVLLILNIFWLMAFFFKEYDKRIAFFSRLNFITPFFVAWHYLGLIREVRYFIPIGLILVPLGMSLLFPESIKFPSNNRDHDAQ